MCDSPDQLSAEYKTPSLAAPTKTACTTVCNHLQPSVCDDESQCYEKTSQHHLFWVKTECGSGVCLLIHVGDCQVVTTLFDGNNSVLNLAALSQVQEHKMQLEPCLICKTC